MGSFDQPFSSLEKLIYSLLFRLALLFVLKDVGRHDHFPDHLLVTSKVIVIDPFVRAI
jgi:hypothetical protein